MNVSPLQPHNETQPDEQTLSQYAEHTRKSLIARLENWEDQRTWDEFYRTYWRLIYSVALKAGCDARCALIGPGVHASHGMERTHIQGLSATLQLLWFYLDCQ